MKTEQTAPILLIVFANFLNVQSSPVGLEKVWRDRANDESTQEPFGPYVALSDEEFLDFMDEVQRHNDKQNSERFGNGDYEFKRTLELERYQARTELIQKMLDSWNRASKSKNVEKQLKQHSKKKLHKIISVAGFAIFVLTCVITFIFGMLACCGKLDRFCFRRSRGSNLDPDPELNNNNEGLLDYYPEFDNPPAYSDLYCDTYKHQHECAHLNPETEQLNSEPESPPPPYTEVS